jgi:hypothetical protein
MRIGVLGAVSFTWLKIVWTFTEVGWKVDQIEYKFFDDPLDVGHC